MVGIESVIPMRQSSHGPCHVEMQLRYNDLDDYYHKDEGEGNHPIVIEFSEMMEDELEKQLVSPSSTSKSPRNTIIKDSTQASSSNNPCKLGLMPTSSDVQSSGEVTEDDTSVGSVLYFEPTDFKPSNWKMALDAPTVGLAVVAITLACAHPLLFMAGALTAFGAATALGSGYDIWTDNPLTYWCTRNQSHLETTPLPANDNTNNKGEQHDQSCSATDTLQNNDQEQLLAQIDPNDIQNTQQAVTHQSTIPTVREHHIQENELGLYFPPLENVIVEEVKFVGLDVVQLFHVFFADDAPYNFQEFQKIRGDKDIVYHPWKDLPLVGVVSMHPKAIEQFPSDKKYRLWRGRVQNFKAKTNSYFGPPFATTTKTQRILILSKKLAVLESETVLADIPFSDRFSVMERWIFKAEKDEEKRYVASGSATCQVFFTKSCPFESQILSKSASTVGEVSKAWCKMATKAMELTELTKESRLRKVHEDDETDWYDGQDLNENNLSDLDTSGSVLNTTNSSHLPLQTNDDGDNKSNDYNNNDGVEVEHHHFLSTNQENEPDVPRVRSEPELHSPKRSVRSFRRTISSMLVPIRRNKRCNSEPEQRPCPTLV